MSNIQLANNLRFLRTKHKLTQDDLSSLLNISRQAYSNYETSKRTPDLDSLLHISRFYRISIDELVLDNLQSTYHTSCFENRRRIYSVCSYGKRKKIPGNSIYLSREELDFIIKYRALSEENKQILAGFLSKQTLTDDYSVIMNPSCTAFIAFSMSFSSTSTVILISEVEIILILTLEL